MQTSENVLLDDQSPTIFEFGKAIRIALNGVRRRGLPGFIEPDDLKQQAEIALFHASPNTLQLAVKVASDAMVDYLRAQSVRQRGVVGLDCVGSVNAVCTSADFFLLPVVDDRPVARRIGKVRTLKSRHEDWEKERAARWASVRGDMGVGHSHRVAC